MFDLFDKVRFTMHMNIDTKAKAIRLFGGTQAAMARALGVSTQAISQWPETLTQAQRDRLVGAAIRLGKVQYLPAYAGSFDGGRAEDLPSAP
jgi:transcriptional regulator with XRE-family HTH domain